MRFKAAFTDKPLAVHGADGDAPFHAVHAVLLFFLNPDFKKTILTLNLGAPTERGSPARLFVWWQVKPHLDRQQLTTP